MENSVMESGFFFGQTVIDNFLEVIRSHSEEAKPSVTSL